MNKEETGDSSFHRMLSEMVAQPDEDIDLARAAFYISGTEHPELDVDHYLGVLDSLADGASRQTGQVETTRAAIELLSQYLFEQEGFRGNDEDYYDPRNSYLNDVLDRRVGIPITLSLVYMEVARRLGMVFEGIGLPGHFVIRTGPPEDELYVNPFNHGQLMTKRDCELTVQNLFQGRVEFREDHLRPYTKREFLVRVLANLKNNYSRAEDYRRAISAADLIWVVDPSMATNIRDRAWLYYALKQYRMAIADLESYLKAAPEAEDAEEVRQQIQAIWSLLQTLN